MATRGRRLGLAVVLLALTVTLLVDRDLLPSPWAWCRARVTQGHPAAPTVVLAVLDTVRADRTSLCGYHRPTTPTLERLRAQGASFTCRAYAPGSWTLPSHASFFTGVPTTEHHAHFLPQEADASVWFTLEYANRLDDTLPTLAEEMARQGYQTAGVSANPVVSDSAGLARGFTHFHVDRERFQDAGWVLDRLRHLLQEEVRRGGPPLFLFLNLMEAHSPWPVIPEGLGWVEPRAPLPLDHSPDGAFARFLNGGFTGAERAELLQRVGDLYDHGVYRADLALGQALQVIEDQGWARAGLRVVVASDHGEFLGEHGLLDHGRHVWEEVIRTPLLVWETPGPPPPLPEPISALHVFHLVRDGALPEHLAPVHAAAWPDPEWMRLTEGRVGGSTWATVVDGTTKDTWRDGEWLRYDLVRDPTEASGSPPVPGPAPALADLVEAIRSEEIHGAPDPGMMEALRAVGYVE